MSHILPPANTDNSLNYFAPHRKSVISKNTISLSVTKFKIGSKTFESKTFKPLKNHLD